MRLVQKAIAALIALLGIAAAILALLGNAVDRDGDRSLDASTLGASNPTATVTLLDPNIELTRGVVERVSDGDTLRVRIGSQIESVRLVGIDAPETATTFTSDCLADDARDYLARLVNGKTIYLEKDVSDRDQYGRLLRYVWLPKGDGHLLVNDLLVGRGLAVARVYSADERHAARLAATELDALRHHRGIWGACVTSTNHDTPGAPAHWNGRSDLDCSDFATRANAQAFYAARGGPQRDPHNLDIDRDGRVCLGRRPTEPSG